MGKTIQHCVSYIQLISLHICEIWNNWRARAHAHRRAHARMHARIDVHADVCVLWLATRALTRTHVCINNCTYRLCTFHYFHAVFITTLFKAINLSLLYTQFCG